MYRAIVFFDIDHTLLNSQGKLLKSSEQALQALKQNHVLPVIASGRNLSQIQPILSRTGISNAVCDNGSHFVYNGHSIFSKPIAKDTLKSLMAMAERKHNPLALQSTNTTAFTSKKRVPKDSIKRYDYAPVKRDFASHHPIIFISLFTQNHHDDKEYQKAFGDKLEIVRNCAVCLDVTAKGISKGTGVAKMIKLLKLDSIPSFCFGNGLNDIPMFKHVDYPISMGNGRECKRYAKFITKTCDDGGIAYGIQHILKLLKK